MGHRAKYRQLRAGASRRHQTRHCSHVRAFAKHRTVSSRWQHRSPSWRRNTLCRSRSPQAPASMLQGDQLQPQAKRHVHDAFLSQGAPKNETSCSNYNCRRPNVQIEAAEGVQDGRAGEAIFDALGTSHRASPRVERNRQSKNSTQLRLEYRCARRGHLATAGNARPDAGTAPTVITSPAAT